MENFISDWFDVCRRSFDEEFVYATGYAKLIQNSIRQCRTVADAMDTSPLKEVLEEILNLAKGAKGVSTAADLSTMVEEQAIVHCIVVDAPLQTEAGKAQYDLVTSLSDEKQELVGAHEKLADRKIREVIRLVPETTHRGMVDNYKDSAVVKMHGEEDDDGYVMIYLDAKQVCESYSSPAHRLPQISAQAVKKLVAPIMEPRLVDGELGANDMYVFCDGGRHGIENSLLGSLTDADGKAISKHKKDLVRHVHGRRGCFPKRCEPWSRHCSPNRDDPHMQQQCT